MMSRTPPPLSHAREKQPHANTGKKRNNSVLRSIVRRTLINALIPFLIAALARPHMSAVNALLLANVVPVVFTLGKLIVKKRFDAIGVLVVVGLLITTVFALLFKDPRILLLKHSVASGVYGLVMVISLLFSRPALFYFVRSMLTQGDPTSIASFNASWSFPQYRSFYRTLTAVWGWVSLAQALLLAVLAFTLPISLTTHISPIISFGPFILVGYWTFRTVRKNRPIFEQLRQQGAPESRS